ncbi:hypothetical protein FB45DRAFT_912120 [Roridomyces roridus]|uniref:J domain-containing protein n=1 Tax=Roridomyces roridus TaxID=1738132 RepID=A0AAD7BX87_9AGAR|nr:hypothetical protein FB45DRAFT_912120 [Roridomyces roridus]
MEFREEVVEAFALLELSMSATSADITRSYRKKAIQFHPDKNPNDPTATDRFQKLGAAYDVCLEHLENPHKSYVQGGGSYSDQQDGTFVDEDDLAFFMFMFQEAFFSRRANRRNYRSRPTFNSAYYSPSYSYSYYPSNSGARRLGDDSQARHQREYEKRLREFEMEIAAEKQELEREAKEKSKEESRRGTALKEAFSAARAGDAPTVIRIVNEFGFDINGPEKLSKHAALKTTDKAGKFSGAITDALNDAKLHPLHVAITCGNVTAVKFLLSRRGNGNKSLPGCHPSKVAPDGRTPLQIAITGGSMEMIAFMTKEATVHDVERCWQQSDDAQIKEILAGKKGFVDPETKEALKVEAERQLTEKREREEQRLAEERARHEEKMRLKEERARKAAERRAADELKRQQEQEALEEARRRQAEHEEKLAAEARRRAEEAEAVRQAAEARVRAEAQARQLAEEQKRARRQAEEEARLRKAQEMEARQRQREAEAALARQQAEEAEVKRRAAVQAEALRIAAAESARLMEVAAQEAERNRRLALEQQKVEAKRAETLRRLEAQAEEHRRQALKVEERRVVSQDIAEVGHTSERGSTTKLTRKTNKQPRDVSQLSAEELEKRAAQRARDKARIAEERRGKMEALTTKTERPSTPSRPEEDDMDNNPPTPVSMPSPSQQRRLPSLPPAVPRHTRPNVPAKVIQDFPEDIQTVALADDLFAIERAAITVQEGPAPRPFRGYSARGRYRGRGRGSFDGRGRGRGKSNND